MMDMKGKAKIDVLKKIRDIASSCMADDMKAKGLKKVSVAADSTEGLEAGLDKAKELLEKKDGEPSMADHMAEMMGSEESSEEEYPAEEESLSDIEAKIKELEDKKAKLMK